MTDLTLTTSERFLLNEVDSVPDKTVRWSALRHAARHLTSAGFSRVIDRMQRRNLLAREDANVGLTFKGMRALKA